MKATTKTEMEEVIAGWKEWHRQFRVVLGVEFNVRDITLQEAKKMVSRLKTMRTALEAVSKYGKPGTTDDGVDVGHLVEMALAK